MQKKIFSLLILLAMIFSIGAVMTPPALAQSGAACESDVVVQADDWLSKLAEKFYGDPLAYSLIFEATNAATAADSSYATIADANLIEVGWKLCVPAAEGDQAMAESEFTDMPENMKDVEVFALEDSRNYRFCEVILVGTGPGAEGFNSSGLNECPAENWDAIDAEQVAAKHNAQYAILNGPKFWMMDYVTLGGGGVAGFEGVDMYWAGTVPAAGLSEEGGDPYAIFNPKKTQVMIYEAGKKVYELVDPDGTNYLLQARGPQFTEEELDTLGERMVNMPEGWEYRVRVLEEDLVLNLTPDMLVYGTADEFYQYYTHPPESE